MTSAFLGLVQSMRRGRGGKKKRIMKHGVETGPELETQDWGNAEVVEGKAMRTALRRVCGDHRQNRLKTYIVSLDNERRLNMKLDNSPE